MPFVFVLSTTSALSFSSYFHSDTHPSLIPAATTHRIILRNVLKKHKRLASPAKTSDLNNVLAALTAYAPYLFAVDAGLCAKKVNDEEIDVILEKELAAEWRPSLAPTIAGRDVSRVKGQGLDFDLCFTLNTLACTYSLLGRAQLLTLYGPTTPSAEERTGAITSATKSLLSAASIHEYLCARSGNVDLPSLAVDISSSTQNALTSLALAEATLLAVLKDDPYPAVVTQDRNKDDREWMIKAPEIPKVRAHLFARLSLAAAEHAGRAHALLSDSSAESGKVNESLVKYTKELQKTARAKACRFFGIDAELGGKTGEGIAWLIGGKKELRVKFNEDDGTEKRGLAKFKKHWTERREDKKIEKGGEWGTDAGRLEEGRVIEMLEKKWNKTNDMINTQRVPASDSMVVTMPSGREIYTVKAYCPPALDADALARMRAPLDDDDQDDLKNNDSDESDDEGGPKRAEVPGAFPGPPIASDGLYY